MSASSLVDHNAMIGTFPFRALPDPTPQRLVSDMNRLGIAHAWVGHLPSIWYRDVAAGNDELFAALEPFRERLHPVPAVNPAWPAWQREVERAAAERCPAVRVWPAHHGYPTSGPALAALAAACAGHDLSLLITMRLEDARQKSRLDIAPDLIGADVRHAVRAHPEVRLLVTAADRAIVEEVHWGSTPDESARIRWDISWIWGAPEDHLAHLVRTVGRERFVFGSHFPFRLPESAVTRFTMTG